MFVKRLGLKMAHWLIAKAIFLQKKKTGLNEAQLIFPNPNKQN